MKTIKNRLENEIKIFAETLEFEAYNQIKTLANFEPYLNAKIRIMPDAHAGKGCTIGTTMTLRDKITPNLVGVDIGCGMLTTKLKEKEIDLQKLDDVIRKYIPSGFSIRDSKITTFDFSGLICYEHADIDRAMRSIGTLGGGNHFIEIDRSDNDGSLYLVIHSGSRNLGVNVCRFYQDRAYKAACQENRVRDNVIYELKRQGREKEIQSELKKLKGTSVSKELAFVEKEDFENYINDMKIVQNYASVNRGAMADIILEEMGLSDESRFETVHNYIDTGSMILRKGAVSAQKGEILLIPINMRDGALICRGKGNEDWNYSAPHGAGRVLSRSRAKELIKIDDYINSMKNIFTTSVNELTIDEAPQAYKPMNEIINTIGNTVDVLEIIKPIYNFKAN